MILRQLFWPIIPAAVASIAGCVILWFISPIFAFILMAWILIHLGITLAFTRAIDAYEHRHGEARSTLLGKIVDSFTNNFAVNLFYRFEKEKSTISFYQKEEETTNILAQQYTERMTCFTSLFFFLGAFLCMNGSLIYFWLHYYITTGQAIQVFMTVWSITAIMWVITRATA